MNDIIKKLIDNKITISFAESCTGGALASTLTKVAGVSSIFKGSFVTYSDEYKIKFLNVKKETINSFGVVSKEVAEEMVQNLKDITKADLCVSVTGNAGPTLGDITHPLGRIYVGLNHKNLNKVYELNLYGSREKIIDEVVSFVYSKIGEII